MSNGKTWGIKLPLEYVVEKVNQYMYNDSLLVLDDEVIFPNAPDTAEREQESLPTETTFRDIL